MEHKLENQLKEFRIEKKYQKLFETAFKGEVYGDTNNETIPSNVIENLITIPVFKERIRQQLIMSNVTITGDTLELNHIKANFPIFFINSTFEAQIQLTDSKTETLAFINCKFKKSILLTGAHIDGQLNFKGSKLYCNDSCNCINAQNAIVKGHVSFCADNDGNEFKIEGKIDLEDITINGNLDCTGAGLSGKKKSDNEESGEKRVMIFSSARITGNVWLDKVKSKGQIRCVGAEIGGDLKCRGGEFLNSKEWAINAKQIKVNGNACFNDKFEIKGGIKLSGATIKGKLLCCDAKLSKWKRETKLVYALLAKGIEVSGGLFLNRIELTGDIDLTDSEIQSRFELLNFKTEGQASKNKIILKSLYAKEYHDDKSLWNYQLDIQDFTYDVLCFHNNNNGAKRNKAKGIKNDLENRLENNFFPTGDSFSHQPYLQMAKVLENSGHESESTWLRIKMYDNKRKSTNIRNWKVWLWLLLSKPIIGYGYKPFKVVNWAVAVWLLGVLFYAYSNANGHMQPQSQFAWTKDTITADSINTSNTIVVRLYEYYPKFDPLIYSLDTFLPIVNLGQQDYWRPIANKDFEILGTKFSTSYLIYFMYLEILLGWFLTSMLIYGISGLVKKRE